MIELLKNDERKAKLGPLIESGWEYRFLTPSLKLSQEIEMKDLDEKQQLTVSSVLSDFGGHHDLERLFKIYIFADFCGAFSFMTQIAMHAERFQHHPEWQNVYNRVSIAWRTHDVNGLSSLDVEMAELCDRLYSKYTI